MTIFLYQLIKRLRFGLVERFPISAWILFGKTRILELSIDVDVVILICVFPVNTIAWQTDRQMGRRADMRQLQLL